jgi:hypothetical protein
MPANLTNHCKTLSVTWERLQYNVSHRRLTILNLILGKLFLGDIRVGGKPPPPVWFVFRSLSSHRIALNARCARHGSDVAYYALRSLGSVLCDLARCWGMGMHDA